MKRRDFMRVSAGGAAVAASSSLWSRHAKAAVYGQAPEHHENLLLPPEKRAQSILEVFMYGGVSPWETFYANEAWGRDKGMFLHTFPDRTVDATIACGYDQDVPPLTFFAKDSDGKDVFLGPFLRPLLERPDVVNRMRIVINRHALEPHEAAIPYAVSGKTLGSPSLAALGAHIQRHFIEKDTTGRTTPYAYGFATAGSFIPNDNVLSLVATGLHPGSARPLLIKVDNAARLNQLLDRVAVGSVAERARHDQLMNAYFAQYQEGLKFSGTGELLRSSRFGELHQAAKSVQGSDDVKAVLDPTLFVPGPDTSCRETNNNINVPKMSLALATHLLTHPTSPARHCCVMDTGLVAADGGGGYDTHSEMSFKQSGNLRNMLVNLLSRINEPGENNPNKIDLDKTMVILNQEFGRAPTRQGTGNGRNHWPYGYMQVYIGGPITEEQRGVYGSISPETAQATTFTTPTENRIAALLAMGIWPFDQAGFSSSDVQGQTHEPAAIVDVTKRILGYDV